MSVSAGIPLQQGRRTEGGDRGKKPCPQPVRPTATPDAQPGNPEDRRHNGHQSKRATTTGGGQSEPAGETARMLPHPPGRGGGHAPLPESTTRCRYRLSVQREVCQEGVKQEQDSSVPGVNRSAPEDPSDFFKNLFDLIAANTLIFIGISKFVKKRLQVVRIHPPLFKSG
jgi:hypothetical protein